jgi:hypothetical protein
MPAAKLQLQSKSRFAPVKAHLTQQQYWEAMDEYAKNPQMWKQSFDLKLEQAQTPRLTVKQQKSRCVPAQPRRLQALLPDSGTASIGFSVANLKVEAAMP